MSDKKYEVGYCRPPKKHCFQKGQSGNPNGRPRGALELISILDQELARAVMVTEGGRRKKYCKAELIVRMQVDKAAKGDSRAFAVIQALEAKAHQQRAQVSNQSAPAETEIPDQVYEQMLEALIQKRMEDGQ